MKTFKELSLISPLHKALAEEKYETPTPIQAQTIPAALDGRDVLGCAQTGTGKTAAFALPILNYIGEERIAATPREPVALILAPTRELAVQIGESIATYGRHLRIRHALVYGGVSAHSQVQAMKKGVQIVVATPGRLLDLINQRHIDLRELEIFVLDEADRMLDMGFLPDLKRIIAMLPHDRQSMFYSATMPPEIIKLAEQLLHDPIRVNVTPPKSTSLEAIEQRVLFVDQNSKTALLKQMLQNPDVRRAIVFTKTKRRANMVAEQLQRASASAAVIHGNKSQNARQRALNAFRDDEVRVLVATDVAARGIDVDGITHVVNFDMPLEPEAYVHRIGRTGRAGASGIALSFCSHDERDELRAIERLIGHAVNVDPEHPEPQGMPRRPAAENQARGARGTRSSGRRPEHRQNDRSRSAAGRSNGGRRTQRSAPETETSGSGDSANGTKRRTVNGDVRRPRRSASAERPVRNGQASSGGRPQTQALRDDAGTTQQPQRRRRRKPRRAAHAG